MDNLAAFGFDLVDDNVIAGNHQRKLALIRNRLGLSQPDAEAALEVFREAAEATKRIRKAVAAVPNDR